ncbi:MAG: hypothetical protein IJM37_09605 [Lachnospiraceae bacterium]|nr:hypothetical protein [Lachnospiraceae bacterium]
MSNNTKKNKKEAYNKKIIIGAVALLVLIAAIITAVAVSNKNKGSDNTNTVQESDVETGTASESTGNEAESVSETKDSENETKGELKTIDELIDEIVPESSTVEKYQDDEGRTIAKVTDEEGHVVEYFVNDDGYLVTRVKEDISDNPDDGQKIIDKFEDDKGNKVTETKLPDGTTVVDITTPEGGSTKEVEVPDTSLTEYISHGDPSKTIEIKTPGTTKFDYHAITGFAPMYSSSDSKNVVFGIELPYAVGDTGMVIEAIGSFAGPYVEDGKDQETENVLSLVVMNNSDEMVQYSSITFNRKNGDPIRFIISNLPPKTPVLVQELNGVGFEGTEKITFDKEITAKIVSDMHPDEVTITASDNMISLTNKTDKTIKTAYVYYKLYTEGGVYLGGITYRAKIENVAPGATVTQGAAHYFIESSEVLCVDIGYEE